MSVVPQQKYHLKQVEIGVSSYDKISAWLTAFIVLIGFLVGIMFLIWLTLFSGSPPKKPVALQELYGNENRPEGIADDIEEPGVEEFPEVDEPQLSDALEAVTDVPSNIRGQLEKVDGWAVEMGTGSGLGDIRESGPGTGNARIIPEWQRWQIEYASNSRRAYAAQLDYFGIEVAAVSNTTTNIAYVRNLAAGRPTAREGSSEDEKRIYFSYNKSRLKKWDRDFIKFGGFDIPRSWIVVQFYSDAVRSNLLAIERARFEEDGRSLEEVRKTIFRVNGGSGGYEYFVHDIKYRPKPR